MSWAIVALMAVADAVWIGAAGFTFDVKSAVLPGALCALFGLLILVYRRWRPDEALATTLVCLVQIIAFTNVGIPLSYLIASLDRPLWDANLHQWDLALGLDWRAYLAWTNANPTVGLVFTTAYRTLMPQMILAITVLGLSGRLAEVRVLVASAIIAGLATVLISGALPAVAMYVHLGLQPADYPNLSPAAAYVHIGLFDSLRDGTLRSISLDGAEGLVTFPSYHAALGVIFLVSLWAVPWLRWPAFGLNAILIAATPIDGGHYFVDVIAGVAVAALSILAAQAVHRAEPKATVHLGVEPARLATRADAAPGIGPTLQA